MKHDVESSGPELVADLGGNPNPEKETSIDQAS